ncbi:hypothetical protein D9M72_525240 [compost metagenome]
MLSKQANQIPGTGQFRGIGHALQRTAGCRQHFGRQGKVGVPKPSGILGTAPGSGQERPLRMDAGDEALTGEHPKGPDPCEQVVTGGRDKTGQKRGGAVSVQEVHCRAARVPVAAGEVSARRPVAVQVHQPWENEAPGRQLQLHCPGVVRGVKAVLRSGERNSVANDGHYVVRQGAPVGEHRTGQDEGPAFGRIPGS